MGLMSQVRQQILNDREKFGRPEQKFTHRTGIPAIDFLNAQRVADDQGKETIWQGLNAGAPVMFIGRPGASKTSIAVKVAYNIVKPFEDGQIYFMDYENGFSPERFRQLTGCSLSWLNDHFILNQVDIYAETILNLVNELSKFKLEHKKELLVDDPDGHIDETGKVIKIMPPTIILVDSWAFMSPKDFASTEEKDFNVDTHPMKEAKIIKGIFKQIVQPCKASNIIILSTNHINDNVSTGVTPPVSITRYLKNTETIPGGKALAFVTDTLIKIEAKDKLEPDSKTNTYKDVKGFEAEIILIKSRLAAAGRSMTAIFSQNFGIDEVYTAFELLKKNGGVTGSGTYALAAYPDYKFKVSGLKQKLSEDSDFAKAYWDQVKLTGESLIKLTTKLESEQLEKANQFDALSDKDEEDDK